MGGQGSVLARNVAGTEPRPPGVMREKIGDSRSWVTSS